MSLQNHQIQQLADQAFHSNVGINYVYVASDGKVFLPQEKHFADLHAKENNLTLEKIEKK